ncbi:hypothetical protein GALL_463420 [mine drainage metagenome]|uniref:Uncharacterized protein n=1 Tax=mine drainage metagenome TaxID=410659 RepID=A0A1J5Q7W5_9ZZZZ
MEVTTRRWVITSRKAAMRGENCSGRRFSGKRVSGWRSVSHPDAISAKTITAPKMPRQPKPAMMSAPIEGAMAGTSVKIIMAKDTMRAMLRPE